MGPSSDIAQSFIGPIEAAIRAGGLEEVIARTLAQHPVPPQFVEIEITEKIVLCADARTLSTLTAIRDLGVGIAFDVRIPTIATSHSSASRPV